jgi:hypothetical protein
VNVDWFDFIFKKMIKYLKRLTLSWLFLLVWIWGWFEGLFS